MLKKWYHIFNMSEGRPNYGKLQSTILRRIRAKGVAWAFTPIDFADLGDPRSVGMVLSRLTKRQAIRRVRHGLYEIPHQHPIVGTVGATAEAITAAVARRSGLKMMPSGSTAANELGLSTQVSAQKGYRVVGPRSRTVSAGDVPNIEIKGHSGKAMALAGRASGHLAEALRNLGKDNISKANLKALRMRMNTTDRRQLMDDLKLVPAWMRPLFKEVARAD